MVTDSDFDRSDRDTKGDYTASTTNLLVEKFNCSRDDIVWYEFSSAATFVPYGSELTYTQAPIDLIMVYKGKFIWYYEIKGRWKYPSTYDKIVNEGSFCNEEKVKNFELMVDGKIKFCYYKKDENGEYILNSKGKKIFDHSTIYDIPKGKLAWGELYRDNVVRTWWNLEKIGLDTLKPRGPEIMIADATIDPDGKKITQKRGYLQQSDAMEYKRIEGS